MTNRHFVSSMETLNDFPGMYVITPGTYGSTHQFASDKKVFGRYSHKAWILGANDVNNDSTSGYLPHRGYPTVQFQTTSGGVFNTPCMVTLWVYLDISLSARGTGHIDDWFSFETFTTDPTNNWSRTITINVNPDGYVRLVHVPGQNDQTYIYQATSATDPSGSLLYPMRQWVRLDAYLDFSPTGGYAKVWQNKQLVSYASVVDVNGTLAQAHFGLYASAAVASGTVWNDELRIVEVANEVSAMQWLHDDLPVIPTGH